MTSPRTFVLVHGAWHGGWCWRRVADRLRREGHQVFTPTLTGVGERAHLIGCDISLATHIADVVNVITSEDLADVVLCGHSYGGFVISGVAEEAEVRVAAIVFLDAFVPHNGEAMADIASRTTRDAIAATVARGERTIAPISAAFFRVNDADRAWVDGRCTPHPIATMTERIALTGARERIAKKAYVRASGYPSGPFDATAARLKAQAGWQIHNLPCGHDAMVDMPEAVAEILVAMA